MSDQFVLPGIPWFRHDEFGGIVHWLDRFVKNNSNYALLQPSMSATSMPEMVMICCLESMPRRNF
jgi:hypothetical protein